MTDQINSARRSSSLRNAGFTLVELLVAMAILGIVLGVAIPNYRQWVLESGRSEAMSVLMQGAQTLERCFTRYSAYNDGNCALGAGDTVMSENNKYQLTVSTVTANTFSLTAAPQGKQAEDTKCGSFTLSNTGARGVSTGTDPAECW
ncbi:MAG: type IV pilin protein [Wenzhouxiangellaceae bacterium]